MLSSHARRRMRQFQVVTHLLSGLTLVVIALRHEGEAGPLSWMAGIAAVLLLGLVGWEQLQPGGQPLAAELVAELLGIAVLLGAALPALHRGAGVLPFLELVLLTLLAAAVVLHRHMHRTGDVAEKGAG